MPRVITKFFHDRGTHLAAMIAYFALLSMVPLTFLALALLGATGRADESSYLVRELRDIFPSSPVSSIVSLVEAVRDNAATLGIVGAVFLVWTSLSLFSVLESAFNIVYGRPNRAFLHGKALALAYMVASLVVLFVGLVAGSLGHRLIEAFTPDLFGNAYVGWALSLLVSTLAVFVFLLTSYHLLTNAEVSVREALPGAVLGAVLLQATFQVLPAYLRLSKEVVALQAFGGPAILLVWLYVMANVIVLGAEVNWWLARGRGAGEAVDGSPWPREP